MEKGKAKALGKGRKCYDVSFKLKAVKATETSSKKAVAKKFGIDRRRVQEWCQQEKELKQMAKSDKRLRGGGRKVRYQDIEKTLIDWFKDRRDKGV